LLTLPLFYGMTDQDADDVIDTLTRVMEQFQTRGTDC